MNFTMAHSPENITGLVTAGTWLNSITGDLFWTLALVAIYSIFFIVGSKYRSMAAFLFAGFSVTILSPMLFYLGWVESQVIFGSFGLLILAIIAAYFFDE